MYDLEMQGYSGNSRWVGDLLCQGFRTLCACVASATPCAGLAGAGLGLNVGDLL